MKNLIPNLIETVKGYMAHEAGLLSEIVKLRSRSKETRAVAGVAGAVDGSLSLTPDLCHNLLSSLTNELMGVN
jgi:hypothetical protein